MPTDDLLFLTATKAYMEHPPGGDLIEVTVTELHIPVPEYSACGATTLGFDRKLARDDIPWRDHCPICHKQQCDICDRTGEPGEIINIYRYKVDGLQGRETVCPDCIKETHRKMDEIIAIIEDLAGIKPIDLES